MGCPTTSISGNNVRKLLLVSDFLAYHSGIPSIKFFYYLGKLPESKWVPTITC